MKNLDWMLDTPFAHRGLHDNREVPENTLEAFRLAMQAGFGSELDVYLTQNGELIVHHDPTLRRSCGKRIHATQIENPQDYKLMGTQHTIPRLRDVLDLIHGQVGLIIEIKTCSRPIETCVAVNEMLASYTGNYAIESFDPKIVQWWLDNRPDCIVGQLYSDRPLTRVLSGENRMSPHVDFFACPVQQLGNRLFRRMRTQFPTTPMIAWTMRDPAVFSRTISMCDNYIFEYNKKNPAYIPLPTRTH